MENEEYNLKVKEITDKIESAMNVKLCDISDMERVVVPSYLFGMINAYSMKNGATHIQVQAAVVAALINRFGYDVKSAVDYFFFLVDATKKENHPAINHIICRGLDHYEFIDDKEFIKNQIDRMVSILSEDAG